MVQVKCVSSIGHAGDAAVNVIDGPCRVHMVYTINTTNRNEQALQLYDENTDSGTSMTYKPSVSIATPKDSAFSFCKDFGGYTLTGGFGFFVSVALKTYNNPSGTTWKSPKGGIVFNRGVSLLPTGTSGSDVYTTTIFYSTMGRRQTGVNP